MLEGGISAEAEPHAAHAVSLSRVIEYDTCREYVVWK